jgi:hypothetical protein
MRIARSTRVLLLAGLAAGLVPVAAAAQGVTVTSGTSIKAGGALGMVFRMAGASNTVSTTYVAGHRMRTDNKDVSSIIDVDAGRFTTLNHKPKTYSTMTFEEMAAAMKSAQEEMKAERAKDARKAEDQKPSDIEWQTDVSAERTGQHQRIAGYDAQQLLVTVTVTAREKGKPSPANPGALVALMDIWTSSDAPNAAAMEEFNRAYAQRMNTEFSSQMKGLEAAFNSDPRMKTALEATAKEMAKVKGVALKSTTSMIAVPEGMKFDRQLALGASDKADAEAKADEAKPKPKGGLFGKLKAAAAQAEQQGQAKDNNAPATQSTILSFTSEVQEIQKGVPADAFSVPAGYREVKNDLPRTR